MTIAIIIGTHGCAAEQLLKTAEMLLGNQENIGWIDFTPGENTETIIEKYHNQINQLNTSQGLIFLVDTWGGSPFNAASRVVVNQSKYDVIAGLNIPMLVEILMERDENPSLEKLVHIAIKAGCSGIKALKNNFEYSENLSVQKNDNDIEKLIPSNKPLLDEHMKINFVRIDDRLIHGQVVTRWTKETNVTRIIVVNDEVANDKVRKTLLTQVAPPGITAHVVNVDKMIRVWNNPKYIQDRVMLLFTNPKDIVRVVEQGINIKSVNIGGMAFRQGKMQITNAVSVDKEDIEAFHKLNERGIELEVRKVSNDQKIKIMDLIAKVHQ